MRDITWEHRCESWGAWRVGAQGVSIAPWSRMADGTPMGGPQGSRLPRVNFEALETHELIGHLPLKEQQLLWRVYPKTGKLVDVARSLGITAATLGNQVSAAHHHLRRLLDQRRKGEVLDSARPRPRAKVKRVTVQDGGQRVRVAAVAVEE